MLNKINSKKISKPLTFLLAGSILFTSSKIEFRKSPQYKKMLSVYADTSSDKKVKTKSSSKHPSKSSTKINIPKSSTNSKHPSKSNIPKSSTNSKHPAKSNDKNMPKSSTKHPSKSKVASKVFSVNNFKPNLVANAYLMNVNRIDSGGNVFVNNFKFKIKGGNAELIGFNKDSKDTIITIPGAIRLKDKIYSVTSLGDDCFSGCSDLRNITIPKSVTNLGNYCFYDCRGLRNITIPKNVTSLGEGCFSHCYNLRDITIPNSVTNLGDYCFTRCKSLQNIEISSSVTKNCKEFKISLVKNQFSDSFQKQLVALGFKNVTVLTPPSAENESPNYKNLYNELLKEYNKLTKKYSEVASKYKEVSNKYEKVTDEYVELLKNYKELLMQKKEHKDKKD